MREFKPLQTMITGWYLCFRDGSGTNWEISKDVGLAICEAFEQADKVQWLCGEAILEHKFV